MTISESELRRIALGWQKRALDAEYKVIQLQDELDRCKHKSRMGIGAFFGMLGNGR